MSVPEPEIGVRYPVSIGSSFSQDLPGPATFHTLHCKFMPQSADKTLPGHLTQRGSEIALQLQRSSGDFGATLKGEVSRISNTDAVLIFDGSAFRIELLARAMHHLKPDEAAKNPTPVMQSLMDETKKRKREEEEGGPPSKRRSSISKQFGHMESKGKSTAHALVSNAYAAVSPLRRSRGTVNYAEPEEDVFDADDNESVVNSLFDPEGPGTPVTPTGEQGKGEEEEESSSSSVDADLL